jgi:predicted tellurium resistance membrane protein TerC
MSGWSPPSVPRNWLLAVGVAYALVFAYGLLVLQQLLLVLFPAVLAASVYLVWRLLVAVEAIADALQRIADQQERD